ncbi:MAG: YfiR/HmsC family protein [Desulfococcaceae bacterium]
MALQRNIIPFFLVLLLFLTLPVYAESYGKVPEKLQAALFVKILMMSKEINNGEDLSVYVVNAPEAAAELRKAVGLSIGKSVLRAVYEGKGFPSFRPSVVYIGEDTNIERWIRYCRENGTLSVTGNPGLVEQGVTLGVCMDGEKPGILLNVTASKAENITWNPTLLKISKLYK